MNNKLKQRIEANQVSLCMGLRQARTVDIGQMVAASGFDCLYIDMEHSPISFESVSAICIAATAHDVTPLVRVPALLGQDIVRALDGGAQGVILPHVNTADEARQIVAHAKYPPLGHRSVMGAGPPTAYRPMPLAEVNKRGNAESLVIIMLETPEGIENAYNIAAVPGVDMLLIGSNDLCTEMGIPGQLRHPSLLAAFERVADACKQHGVALGIGGVRGDVQLQEQLLALGAKFIIAGSDVLYLIQAATKDHDALRAVIDRTASAR
jgi:2-keto-3-deoxy-L-rhamnonate aldolase RhmA